MVFSSHFKESISCLKSMNRAPWNLLRVGTFCLHGSIHKKFSFKFYRKTCFLITFPQLVVLINFIHHLFPFYSKVIYIIRIFVNLLLSKNTNFSKKKGKKKLCETNFHHHMEKECPRRFKEKVHLHLKFCVSSLDLEAIYPPHNLFRGQGWFESSKMTPSQCCKSFMVGMRDKGKIWICLWILSTMRHFTLETKVFGKRDE